MSSLVAMVLCGGRSSRMGAGDKPLIELDGRPMVAHVIGRLQGSVDAIAINANSDPDRYRRFGLPVIADATQSFDGPLAGILAGMAWAQSNGASHLVTAAGDTPFFPSDLVDYLRAASGQATIAVAASASGLHPTFALWPVSLRPDLARQLAGGMRKVTDFIARHPSVAVHFEAGGRKGDEFDPFFNVNTPGDLARARGLAAKLST